MLPDLVQWTWTVDGAGIVDLVLCSLLGAADGREHGAVDVQVLWPLCLSAKRGGQIGI